MFEVLLQADKALASGALDQAERAYWQLAELDPTNAIAVAGLARVSLERGDRRLALTFAERALAIDPDNFAAKRVIETLEGRGVKTPASDEPNLPLLAAQRLETLGKRRRTGDQDADISEPLKERGQAGRKATAAAKAAAKAAAEAAAEAAPRPMPRPAPRIPKRPALGDRTRRHLHEPPKLPHRIDDPFAVAESAAAVEAVDELDEADDVALEQPTGPAATDELGQVLGPIGATDEDESIAMRIALVSDQLDATQLEAAELEAATLGAIEAAELRAKELQAAEPIESIAPARTEVELRTSESSAAGAEAEFDNEPPAEGSDDDGDTAGSEATPQRHRKGLLRRFLGG